MTVAEAQNETRPVGVCVTCGRPITHPGPDGECVRCLISVGFLPDAQQFYTNATHALVTPGALKYAEFEVEMDADGFPVVLGAGAMAITYRARDTILNSTVALKVIGRKLAEDPIARARFLREARAAAQIQYPNVARVIRYGEQAGECFYAMQLVRGETLEARVRRDGPLPLSLALEVVEQTARGLAAAEACGVIHRDLKPSNVMIESDPSGQLIVKIIDFGVAKVMAPDTTAKTQAGFIGTPSFASPEQFEETGQRQIDTRSDIYALGVTFWYLLTARLPFAGRSIEEIRAKQTEQLPLEQLKRTHVPMRVVVLLKSMLAVDPGKRPQTALALLTAVHRCYVRFEPVARGRRKRLVIAAGALAMILALATLAALLYQRAQSSSELNRAIAVLPFENHSPNSEDTYFTVGMQDEITDDLAKLAGMKVIGSESTRSYLPGKNRDRHAIGRDLGVGHLLEGTVARENDQLRVTVQLVDLRDNGHPWTAAYQRSIQDVFAVQSEITRAVAAQLKKQLSANEKTLLDIPPTTDLRAYDLYLQARAMPSATLDAPTAQFFVDSKRAIPMLEEAIARDPNFVLAYCELARWHDELYYARNFGPSEERLIDHRSLSEAALEKARRLQPDSGPVHLTLARRALQISNNTEEAETQIQLARPSLPNNAQVEAIAGRIARRKDRWDEALRCLERAVSLEPRDVFLRVLLGETYRFMRRYQECDRMFDSALALSPPEKHGLLAIRRACARLECSADITSLRGAVATQIAAHQLDERETTNAQMTAAFWSHDSAAISRVLSNKHLPAEWNGVIIPDAWFEGLIARMRGDNSAALKAFAVARPQLEEQVRTDPTTGVPLSILAIVDAGLGRTQQAVQEGSRACELTSTKVNNLVAPSVRSNLAVVYAWTGQHDLAIAELSKLIERPAGANVVFEATYGDLRLNPVWDPLRSDPRFQALVQRLAPSRAL